MGGGVGCSGSLLQQLTRGAVTERLVQALVVVEFEVGGDAAARLRHVLVGLEINFLVLETAPQPLHEDVVGEPAAAVHADRDAVGVQHTSKASVGELAALVGVEDLGLPLFQRLFERLEAEAGIEQNGVRRYWRSISAISSSSQALTSSGW